MDKIEIREKVKRIQANTYAQTQKTGITKE